MVARPAIRGHPTDMIPTRAPSRAPFTVAVGITSGPRTCSRAPVGSKTRRRDRPGGTVSTFAQKSLQNTPCVGDGLPPRGAARFVQPRKSSCRNANSPRRADISRGDARTRRFESYVKCSVKVRLHPIGEGNLLCGQSHKFQFHLGIHRNSSSPRLREMPSPWNCQVERSSRRT